MSVSRAPGASLSARQWWCEPGEQVVWALWTHGTTFRVDGCNENGFPKPGMGKRFGSAVGKAGIAVAAGALTGVFGGGEDSGRVTAPPAKGLTVFGPGPECRARGLIRSDVPEGYSAGDVLWVLTPNRLGVLLSQRIEPKDTGPGGWRQLGHGWGDVGRVLVGASPEEFGRNVPGAALRSDPVALWFVLGCEEIVDCQVTGPEHRQTQCAVVLRDGSGFGLDAHMAADAGMMADAVRRYLRGARG
ncbi:hypothetical protein [Saccharopolyspora gloriosae]|uniref:hypothetical protein n=1 Tax=Saccharopolyspora gloriosae TaxID=455344 RepID=UPI001FB7A894|nr:hypothetical protein [Saccharopolyspora gloriosae]